MPMRKTPPRPWASARGTQRSIPSSASTTEGTAVWDRCRRFPRSMRLLLSDRGTSPETKGLLDHALLSPLPPGEGARASLPCPKRSLGHALESADAAPSASLRQTSCLLHGSYTSKKRSKLSSVSRLRRAWCDGLITIQIARDKAFMVAYLLQRRTDGRTLRHGIRTPGTKATARGRIDGVRRVTNKRRMAEAYVRIHRGRGGKQGLRVGMQRRRCDLFGAAHFNNLSEIHHQHTITEVFND